MKITRGILLHEYFTLRVKSNVLREQFQEDEWGYTLKFNISGRKGIAF